MNEIMEINGIKCYEKDGVAYLNLETVARGLGFTKTETKNGVEYVTVRWNRVNEYLRGFGFFDHEWSKDEIVVGEKANPFDFVNSVVKSRGLPEFIPENIFYRLAMKANNAAAEKFQALVADEILPTLRRTGAYTMNRKEQRNEEIRERMIKAKEMNARSRQAALWLKMADKAPNSKPHLEICMAYASEALNNGQMVLPLPQVEKTYTAKEVGDRFGISANMVGRIANEHRMKCEEYGMYVLDKSPNSSKEIETFRYNERGAQKIGEYAARASI